MKVALYQNDPDFGEIEKNVADVLDKVKNQDFDVLVLPELFATGYQFKNREEAISLADEAGSGYTYNILQELSAKTGSLIVYGFPGISGDKLYNSSIAILPDGRFFVYQKTHLFDSEKNIFDPGVTGFFVFEFKEARFGMMVCFDWRYPESARKLSLLGAQVILHPSNLVLPHCPEAMVTRALENNVFTVTGNRIGQENRAGQPLKFIGRSRIISPRGQVLDEASPDKTGFLSADIEPEQADNKQVTPQNDLFKDRRPEYY